MIGKKFDSTATTKTHGQVDATLMDLANPTAELDSTGSMVRSALYFGLGWLGRGYRDNRSVGF